MTEGQAESQKVRAPDEDGLATAAPKSPVSEFKLRGDIPRVMRLSRKTVGIGSAVLLLAIGGAFTYALQDDGDAAPAELYDGENRSSADGLAGAPKDYSEIPQLGPPLPGDLGGPILAAEEKGAVAALPPVPDPQINAAEAARRRVAQERDAARTSQVFLSISRGGSARNAGTNVPSLAENVPGLAAPVPPAEAGFLNRPVIASNRLSPPVDPNVVQAGSIISAALITGIRSDLPGQITAQVTQNVYDSPTGRILLIPQGARLIGEYDADVSFGQSRILLAWTRLILPDGRSILLDRQPGADASGFAGLEDGVNYHWGNVIKAGFVSTLLGVGAELGSGSDDNLTRAIKRGGQDSINQSGQQVVSRELGVKPTLTIRPGFPVSVIVTRDLILAPLGLKS